MFIFKTHPIGLKQHSNKRSPNMSCTAAIIVCGLGIRIDKDKQTFSEIMFNLADILFAIYKDGSINNLFVTYAPLLSYKIDVN